MLSIRLSKQGWIAIFVLAIMCLLYYISNLHPIARLHGNVISVRKLLIHCVHSAEAAGQTIKSNHAVSELNTQIKQVGNGPKNELVTDIDLNSHQLIVASLNNAFNGLKIISEEHPPTSMEPIPPTNVLSNLDSRLPDIDLFVPASDLTIWVDPLDATQELTEGLLEYVTVMICVALHGYPIIGVIHQPFLGRTYWSWKSHGISEDVVLALANATKARSSLSRPLAVTYSRSHLDNETVTRIVEALKPQTVEFIPAGGSGFKVLSLLSGKAHLYVHPSGTRRWDICAPKALLDTVGGQLTGLDGSTLTFRPDDPPLIPSTIGLFAASSVSDYNRWRDRFSHLVSGAP